MIALNTATRLLVLAALLLAVIGLYLSFRPLWHHECEVKWRASSARIVDGKLVTHQTSNCDPE
jgi:hypothetical protein